MKVSIVNTIGGVEFAQCEMQGEKFKVTMNNGTVIYLSDVKHGGVVKVESDMAAGDWLWIGESHEMMMVLQAGPASRRR